MGSCAAPLLNDIGRFGIVEDWLDSSSAIDDYSVAIEMAKIAANLGAAMATRTVSATEAKNRFGAIVKSALESDEVILVENHSEPYVYMVPPGEFERLQEADKELQRRTRLERLESIMRRQAERNSDLSSDEAEALAVRAVREYRLDQQQDPDRA
jgi:prevent-host-death family protein